MPDVHPDEEFKLLEKCSLCPRKCRVNRLEGNSGYCKSGSGFEISSILIHHGEEPAISGKKGICNVFFSRCNLQCIFCQNYQISRKSIIIRISNPGKNEVIQSIENILNDGCESVGFVSPSHMIPQMIALIRALHQDGFYPYVVYNTNGYDSVETLKMLEGWVDVYLPDFKYSDRNLARKWSDAEDYPVVAARAIREMYRQKGNILHLSENGIAERGIIIRHLVMPGKIENSKAVLQFLAQEISNKITISLMSQYHPTPMVTGMNSLNRKVRYNEYQQVVEEMELLGFSKGWVQDHESADFYNPDFESEFPFEKK